MYLLQSKVLEIFSGYLKKKINDKINIFCKENQKLQHIWK